MFLATNGTVTILRDTVASQSLISSYRLSLIRLLLILKCWFRVWRCSTWVGHLVHLELDLVIGPVVWSDSFVAAEVLVLPGGPSEPNDILSVGIKGCKVMGHIPW